jgi:putative hemolysin
LQTRWTKRRLQVELATTIDDIGSTRRLRYRAFAEELGADVKRAAPGIEMHDGGIQAQAIMNRVRRHAMLPVAQRVTPLSPLPAGAEARVSAPLPPLLKAYFRLGAQACGKPCDDPAFNCADILVMVNVVEIDAACTRHFLDPVMHKVDPCPGFGSCAVSYCSASISCWASF